MVPKTWRRDARKPDAKHMSPGSQTRPAMMIVMSSRKPTEIPPKIVNYGGVSHKLIQRIDLRGAYSNG
jgi:hypothetical protein